MILHNTTEQYVTQYIPHNGKDPPSPQWQCATSPPWQWGSYPQDGNEPSSPQWQWSMPYNTTTLYSSASYFVLLHNI